MCQENKLITNRRVTTMKVNADFLKNSVGFVKDFTAPIGVNRWVNWDVQSHYISITLDEEGENTLYGVFIKKDALTLQPTHKVKFDGEVITRKDFYRYMDECGIKTPLHNKFYNYYN